MCKHIEILTASRNAVVLLQASTKVLPFNPSVVVFERSINAHDYLLADFEYRCRSCEYDKQDPERKSDFLRFVTEYVDTYIKTGVLLP